MIDFGRIKLLLHKIRFVLIIDGNKRGDYLRNHQL